MAILVRTNTDANNFLDAAGIARTEANAPIVIGICQLTSDLKQYGLWNKMKAIYPMVGQAGVSSSFQYNLKNPNTFRGTFTGGWTFSSTGATPDGSTGYMDTGLNASTNLDGANLHFSIYHNTEGNSGYAFGCRTFNPRVSFAVRDNTNNTRVVMTDVGQAFSVPNSDSLGFWVLNKPDNTNITVYKQNATALTGNNTGTSLSNLNIFLSAVNASNVAESFDNKRVSFFSIGDGLTTTQASNFYTAVQRFQTTLGRQV